MAAQGGGVVRQGTGLSLGGCRVEQAGHQGKGTEGRRDVFFRVQQWAMLSRVFQGNSVN